MNRKINRHPHGMSRGGWPFCEQDMELENEAKFDVGVDQIEFTTQANGDHIRIKGVQVPKESAAALAYMINGKKILEIQIKEKGT